MHINLPHERYNTNSSFQIKAREAPAFTQSIPNWSPAQDFVTNSLNQEDREYPELPKSVKKYRDFIPQPDRIFTCVGKGSNGAITESRYGLEANIGLEMTYDARILDMWVLSSDLDSFDSNDGSLFLLSLGDRSSVLHLSSDATEIVELDQSSTKFDLKCRTIAASMYGRYQIQVTESSIVLISGPYV